MDENKMARQGGPAAGLIEYQSGAVVSKTLVKTGNGSVTVFAFDQGQELSEHKAPHDAVVLILDGQAEFRVSGTPHPLTAGDLLLMPANAPHGVKATQRFKMLLSMVR